MKKLALTLMVVGLSLFAWRSLRDGADPKLLYDRFWIDHAPRDLHDQHFAMFVSAEHPVGQFEVRTIWEGRWEGFHYRVLPQQDGVLDLIFPSKNERQRVSYRAYPCHENGFDYCLDISGSNRGARRYYSMKQWTPRNGQLDEFEERLLRK